MAAVQLSRAGDREEPRPAPLPGDRGATLPVQIVDEVPHVARQNDPVLPHVPVIPQHAHRDVGWHFRKLPQNIIKCPSPQERERDRHISGKHRSVSGFMDKSQQMPQVSIFSQNPSKTVASSLPSENCINCKYICIILKNQLDKFNNPHPAATWRFLQQQLPWSYKTCGVSRTALPALGCQRARWPTPNQLKHKAGTLLTSSSHSGSLLGRCAK